ncbi:MAG: hypothetical protein Q9194_005980 [Teloschistes cf. exilis]
MGKVRFFFAIETEHTDGARQLLLIPFVVLGMVTVVSYGASSHQWNITLDQVMHFASLANVIEILYHLTIMTTKIAVLLQYLRIFVPTRNRNFYLTWSLIGVNVIINISLGLAFGVQCIPRRKIWTPTLEGRCIDLGAAFLVSAVTNTITDISAFLLPLSSIWELQLPRERKSFRIADNELTDGVNFPQCVHRKHNAPRNISTPPPHPRLYFPSVETISLGVSIHRPQVWQQSTGKLTQKYRLAEITSGVICICAPVLPKLFQRIAGRASVTKGRDTPALYGGSSSKRSTLDKGRKPYVELHGKDVLGDRAVGESPVEEKCDEEKKWERDLEKGLGERGPGGGGRRTGDGDGAIRKTVTIDQTSRIMSK